MATHHESVGNSAASGSAAKPGRQAAGYSIGRYARHWAIRDPKGALVCVTLYRVGAEEVLRRLLAAGSIR